MGFFNELQKFLEQAKTDNLKYAHFLKSYKGTQVHVSFGKGNAARIPWISFTIDPNTTSNGIYPVYLYYKSQNLLILSYGKSETNKSAFSWNVRNVETISEYFDKNLNESPERYGDSYVYKVYNLNQPLNEDEIEGDLIKIIGKYKNMNFDETSILPETTDKEKSTIISFSSSAKEAGLIYSEKLTTRFIASLLTKPFVILSGLSGSGKTKLAQAFAQWICQDEEQYCIVPVGADWTNREPILGYENALEPNKYVVPENGALKLLIEANKTENENKPFFLILDEMNLSHVERYFADFLSVMESKAEFKLHTDEKNLKSDVPHEIAWPKNLFIIGTVNIDETTYMFSPKVLDRANTIEFRVSESEISGFLDHPASIDLEKLKSKGSNMAQNFLKMANKSDFNGVESNSLKEALQNFFKELKVVGAEFGYRTAMEIYTLYHQLGFLEDNLSVDDKIDIAIMQKLLPKLHGSQRKLKPVLIALGNLCVNDSIDIEKDIFSQHDFDFYKENSEDKKDGIFYPISLEKIYRMYRGAIANGFASYAEA